MRCAKARALWSERDALGPLAGPAEADLTLHLAGCPDCAAWTAGAARVVQDLRALRADPPFSIDVTARVIARVTAWPAPRPEELRTGALAWTSLAVLAAAAGLAGALWTVLPTAGRAARGAWLVLAGLRPAISALAEAVAVALTPALRVLGHFAVALPGAASAGRLSPATYVIAAAAMATASTVIFVVGRDLRRPARAREEPPQ